MSTHRLARVTVALTFALMVLGSVVHGTGSSLACPDWPLCNGDAFPRMTGGVEFEHSHRLVALTVALLVATLAWKTRGEARGRARLLARVALGLVVVQAALGALTVVLKLPPAVSVAHFATSLTVLSTLVLLALDTRAGSCVTDPTPTDASRWVGLAAGAAFVQAALGAAVRHGGGALACSTLPLCNGVLVPETSLARLHMVHRALGLAVAVAVIVAGRHVRADAGVPRGARALVHGAEMLVATQVVLGVLIILSGATLAAVTAHHATGVLLLATLVGLWGVLRSPSLAGSDGDAGAPRAPLSHPTAASAPTSAS